MMVMPVTSSPASMARWIGAAPRQRGRSDAWTLRQPWRGRSSTSCGRIRPYAATTIASGAAASSASRAKRASSAKRPSRRRPFGCATAMPCSRANAFTGEATSFRPRPAGRSGWVRTRGDLEAGGVDARQGDAREFRCTGEDDAHRLGRGPGRVGASR